MCGWASSDFACTRADRGFEKLGLLIKEKAQRGRPDAGGEEAGAAFGSFCERGPIGVFVSRAENAGCGMEGRGAKPTHAMALTPTMYRERLGVNRWP